MLSKQRIMKTQHLNLKSKNLFKIFLFVGMLFVFPQQTNAQFLKKLAKKAEEKIEREAEKRSERRVNKKIDKEFDKAEDAIDGKEKKKKEEKNDDDNNQNEKDNNKSDNPDEINSTKKTSKPTVVWSQFDFIPGDEVIYEDGPRNDEENGEFPSRWDLVNGNAEIAEVDGEKVVIFPEGGTIVPYLKNSKEDYLPEVFTVEFDAYFQPEYEHRIIIKFNDSKNQKNVGHRADFYAKTISFGGTSKKYSKNLSKGGWRHFSIAVTKDKLKIYLNDERLINIPHMGFNPTGITLNVLGYARDAGHHQYVKNFRVAKGGVKYYDRVLSDGKIVVNGIKFDVNKATLKPESMGPINKIFKLMQKQPELSFSVEGHTDSDGGDTANMTLSKARGKAVMEKLIAMGISSDRLKSNGFGESKPLDNNSTPEGKANNRRVEFVKF